MDKIAEFQGQYRFLSNFWPARIPFAELFFPTVEHAYQAAKTLNLEERKRIQVARTPGDAKRLGRTVTIREDWEQIKLSIMLELVRRKFWGHPELRAKLLATDNAELIEGNYWNDRFWGVCKGTGQNHLGRILMQVRQELQEKNSNV